MDKKLLLLDDNRKLKERKSHLEEMARLKIKKIQFPDKNILIEIIKEILCKGTTRQHAYTQNST